MKMLAELFEENSAEHAAHQEIIANQLFKVPQERGIDPR